MSSCSELNCADYSEHLDLLAVGGIDGNPEFWDLLAKKKAHDLKLPEAVQGQEITSIRFEPSNALQVAVGTERGKELQSTTVRHAIPSPRLPTSTPLQITDPHD